MLRYLNGLKELTQEKTCRETEENDVEEDGNLCPTWEIENFSKDQPGRHLKNIDNIFILKDYNEAELLVVTTNNKFVVFQQSAS